MFILFFLFLNTKRFLNFSPLSTNSSPPLYRSREGARG